MAANGRKTSRGRFGKQHPTPWGIMFYNPPDSYTYTPVHNLQLLRGANCGHCEKCGQQA